MSTAIKTVLIEDSPIIQMGLGTMFHGAEAVELIGQATSGEEGVRITQERKPDVVLVDLGLPGIDGIEVTRQILVSNPDIKVIVLTASEDREEVLKALSAGAYGYCSKSCPTDELVWTIMKVHDGALWLDPTVGEIVHQVFQSPGFHTLVTQQCADLEETVSLSERETTALQLMVQGKNNDDIAEALSVSVHTAKVVVTSILNKLSVKTRVEAAVKAVRFGIC